MLQTAERAVTIHISKMLTIVQRAAAPLDAQLNDAHVLAIPEAALLFSRIKQTLDHQIDRLHAHLDQLGGHPESGMKEAVSGILGGAAAAIDRSGKTPVSKMLCDDHAALALMTMGFMMLHARAAGLGDLATAEIARRSLEELTPLATDLRRCVPEVIIAELQADELQIDVSAIRRAQESS
jgi:ferritin-like metal-binding protein YciE